MSAFRNPDFAVTREFRSHTPRLKVVRLHHSINAKGMQCRHTKTITLCRMVCGEGLRRKVKCGFFVEKKPPNIWSYFIHVCDRIHVIQQIKAGQHKCVERKQCKTGADDVSVDGRIVDLKWIVILWLSSYMKSGKILAIFFFEYNL